MYKLLGNLTLGGFAFIFSTSMCAAPSFLGGPTPAQSFHQASSASQVSQLTPENQSNTSPSSLNTPTANSDSVSNTSDATQMSRVLAIMQAAKEEAKNTQNTVTPSVPATEETTSFNPQSDNTATSPNTNSIAQYPMAPIAPVTAPGNASSQNAESEVAQLNQNVLLFQQQDDQRFENLVNKENELEDKVQKLDQALVLLNQDMGKLANSIEALKPQTTSQSAQNSNESWMSKINAYVAPYQFLFNILLLIIIASMGFNYYVRQKNRNEVHPELTHPSSPAVTEAHNSESELNDTEAEYDYLNSQEAIPAKLDLARTYLAMEDHSAAKEVLKEVMKSGNKLQLEEAKSLLDLIPTVKT